MIFDEFGDCVEVMILWDVVLAFSVDSDMVMLYNFLKTKTKKNKEIIQSYRWWNWLLGKHEYSKDEAYKFESTLSMNSRVLINKEFRIQIE